MVKSSVSSKLDWNRMLGFEQIVDDRAAMGGHRLGNKVGSKVGNKPGLKIGGKIGSKTRLEGLDFIASGNVGRECVLGPAQDWVAGPV